jgi:competence protein ComEC
VIVPHHGSLTSSSEEFVSAVDPRWAVISSGAGNRFKLPRAEVVERYRLVGANVLNTAETGALRFRLDARETRLLSSRREDRRRYWREPVAPGSGYAIGNR